MVHMNAGNVGILWTFRTMTQSEVIALPTDHPVRAAHAELHAVSRANGSDPLIRTDGRATVGAVAASVYGRTWRSKAVAK